jgi:hypothetical protein
VADELVARLSDIGDGREYSGWLTQAVGKLKPTEDGTRLLKAIRKMDKLILTTNYDHQLRPPARRPATASRQR